MLTTVLHTDNNVRSFTGQATTTANLVLCPAVTSDLLALSAPPAPGPAATPFRTLHLRYPVEDLAEALAEGITTAHPGMPQFQLETGQIGDLIAYLRSLER